MEINSLKLQMDQIEADYQAKKRSRLAKKASKKKFKMAKKRQKKLSWKARLKNMAKELNNNLPKSEQWFYTKFKVYMKPDDMPNFAFMGYIPDILNKRLKYIIEIDGSIHDLSKVQAKDVIKDNKFKEAGYTIYRIKAFDDLSFHRFITEFKNNQHDKHQDKVTIKTVKNGSVLLRKKA